MTLAEEEWCRMMRAKDEAALKVASATIADPAAAAKVAASDAAKTAEAASPTAETAPESTANDLTASLASVSFQETRVDDPTVANVGAVAPPADQSDISAFIAQVEQNPRCVVNFSDERRDNADIMGAAVAADEFLLEYASDRLRDYEPLVLRAVQVQDASLCLRFFLLFGVCCFVTFIPIDMKLIHPI
jgi:hypothetical protein